MAKLPGEVKAMFQTQLPIIATASSDGTPNVGPKGSLHVVDDETLAYAEGTGQKTLKNIEQNPKVAVLVVDRDKADGYQVKGRAELLTSGDVFEKVAQEQEERKRPRPRYVVKINVEEVYSVKPGMTSTRVA